MTKIIIGTTPTITYKFKVVDVTDIVLAILTIKERGTVIIEKDIEDAVIGEDTLRRFVCGLLFRTYGIGGELIWRLH